MAIHTANKFDEPNKNTQKRMHEKKLNDHYAGHTHEQERHNSNRRLHPGGDFR
jgi:hypothetical protein